MPFNNLKLFLAWGLKLRQLSLQNVIRATPVIRTWITRTPPLTRVSVPLDLTQLFSHFYSVNSNSDKSKTQLTWTKFHFLWSKFTPITRISCSYNSPQMPIEISHWPFLSCDRILTLELDWSNLILISATNRSRIWQLFTDHKSHTGNQKPCTAK